MSGKDKAEYYTLKRTVTGQVFCKEVPAENEVLIALDSVVFFNLLDLTEKWGLAKVSHILEILTDEGIEDFSLTITRKPLVFNFREGR